MIIERRQDQRVVAHLPAKWEGMSGIHEARLEDISLSGCFVNSNGRVEVGQVVSLLIEFQAELWIAVEGEVTNYQPGIGFGLAFKSLRAEDIEAIDELLSRQLEVTLT